MTGNIRSWIHYLQIRCDGHTQKEHRLIADEILALFRKEFPVVAEAVWTA
jgi:thymidylate synthase (FAD)